MFETEASHSHASHDFLFDLLFKESGHLRCGGGEKPDFLQERRENYLMLHYITLLQYIAVSVTQPINRL